MRSERGVGTVARAMLSTAVAAAMQTTAIQAQPSDLVGDTVRVEVTGGQLFEGVVRGWSEDGLTLTTIDVPMLQIPWERVRVLDRRELRREPVHGLWIGALVGGVVAGVHAGVTWEPCTALCMGPDDRGGTIALATVLGAGAGGLVGLMIGALIRTPSWEPVVIPRPVGNASITSMRIGMRWSVP